MNCCSWKRFWNLPALFVILIVLIDQLTKYLVVHSQNLAFGGRIEIIPNFFYLVHVRNTGAAWGIFTGQTSLLSLISIVVFVMLAIWYPKVTGNIRERCYAVTLMMGGIGGNLIDRIFRKSVVDFLSFSYKSIEWPSFNVADSAICIGVGIFSISSYLYPDQDANP